MQALRQDAKAAINQGGSDQGVKPAGQAEHEVYDRPQAQQDGGARHEAAASHAAGRSQEKVGQGDHKRRLLTSLAAAAPAIKWIMRERKPRAANKLRNSPQGWRRRR